STTTIPNESPSSRTSSTGSPVSSRTARPDDHRVWHTGRMPDSNESYDIADIEFDAEGSTLRGWLYRPRSAPSPSPVVVMAHGYNCLKELYLDRYAATIASAGHVVVAYDHRNFGDSDGEPRQELDPWVQVRDYRHAITYAQTLDGVAAD